jgi:hypothetical protein
MRLYGLFGGMPERSAPVPGSEPIVQSRGCGVLLRQQIEKADGSHQRERLPGAVRLLVICKQAPGIFDRDLQRKWETNSQAWGFVDCTMRLINMWLLEIKTILSLFDPKACLQAEGRDKINQDVPRPLVAYRSKLKARPRS